VPCATSRLLRRRGAAISRRVGFGEMIALYNFNQSTSPVLEGLLFQYRLAHNAFESCYRSSVFVLLRLVTVVRPWCTYSFGRLNLLDSLLRHTYAMAEVYLDFGIQQMNNPFYYSLTRRSWVKLPTAPGSKDDRYPGIGAS